MCRHGPASPSEGRRPRVRSTSHLSVTQALLSEASTRFRRHSSWNTRRYCVRVRIGKRVDMHACVCRMVG